MKYGRIGRLLALPRRAATSRRGSSPMRVSSCSSSRPSARTVLVPARPAMRHGGRRDGNDPPHRWRREEERSEPHFERPELRGSGFCGGLPPFFEMGRCRGQSWGLLLPGRLVGSVWLWKKGFGRRTHIKRSSPHLPRLRRPEPGWRTCEYDRKSACRVDRRSPRSRCGRRFEEDGGAGLGRSAAARTPPLGGTWPVETEAWQCQGVTLLLRQ